MIWAFGDISNGDIEQHGGNDADDITVYVYGSGCNGVTPTTTEGTSVTQDPSATQDPSDTSAGTDDDGDDTSDDDGSDDGTDDDDDSSSSSGGTDCLNCSSDANLRSVSLVISLVTLGLVVFVVTFA